MGIFGAMTTAITGLKAQSSALENVSNNIANSQTIGYKRTETSFSELVPESPPNQQALGVVQAFTRPTNSVQGDVTNSDVDTHVAINGDGFFVVGEQSGTVDGNVIFAEESVYTRRGDFELDKNGYLVNGSGYYLKGLPVNPSTGNTTGSLPEVIQVSSDVLPASATTTIDYRANLARYPLTGDADATVPLSERLDTSGFVIDPTVAGSGYVAGSDATAFIQKSTAGGGLTTYDASGQQVNIQFRWAKLFPDLVSGGVDVSGDLDALGLVDGDELTLTLGSDTFTIGFNTTGTPGAGQDAAIDLFGGDDADGGGDDATGATLVAAINSLFGSGTAQVNAGTGVLDIQPPDNNDVIITGSAGSVLTGLGLASVGTGSATTRTVESPETWNLFYLTNSTASGTTPAWQNVGVDYAFGSDFLLDPPVNAVDITNLTVDGVNLGTVTLEHGANGITQFADADGATTPSLLTQDGFAAGELSAISISDEGRVVATYSNGRAIDLAEMSLASFSATGFLQKLDGGAFRATQASGEPILGAGGAIIGNALEASNTDIADEFTKLIVTQQAYAANTRVISTSDEMIQEALNIVR